MNIRIIYHHIFFAILVIITFAKIKDNRVLKCVKNYLFCVISYQICVNSYRFCVNNANFYFLTI